MTTNVYDKPAGVLTTDSRWSMQRPDIEPWVAYIDDTGYDKIVFDEEIGILFAGNFTTIGLWKDWFNGGRIGNHPDLDTISIILIDMKTGQVEFQTDFLLESVHENEVIAVYGGSGASYAMDCWQVNRCAKKAVESAISSDRSSGGKVTFLDRNSFETNVTNSASAEDVRNLMIARGMMINKITNQVVPINGAANDTSNQQIKDIAASALSGKFELTAPFPGMDQPWTNEKKAELANVLKKYSKKK